MDFWPESVEVDVRRPRCRDSPSRWRQIVDANCGPTALPEIHKDIRTKARLNRPASRTFLYGALFDFRGHLDLGITDTGFLPMTFIAQTAL